MEVTNMIKPAGGDTVMLVGTTKGAFLLNSDKSRKRWQVSGPHFPGHVVYAMAYDGRAGRRRLWFSSFHWAFGTTLRASDDFGKTWTNPESHPVKFPQDSGLELKQIWQITPGLESDPGRLYCGVDPHALFESRDGGQSGKRRSLLAHYHSRSVESETADRGHVCRRRLSQRRWRQDLAAAQQRFEGGVLARRQPVSGIRPVRA
jgi:hypothetical protein